MQLKKNKTTTKLTKQDLQKIVGGKVLVSIVVLQIVIIHLRISSTDSQTVTKI